MLDKKECLFERDEEGNLIGKPVVLDSLPDKPEVVVRPLTRGKLMSIFSRAKDGTEEEKIKIDNEVILGGLVEPKLTEEELVDMKPKYVSAISMAILSVSLGISQKEISENAKNVLAKQEMELKK
ncbi:MAG: hypothetical protein ACTSXD_11935 [Candidatus Heimdallarchaeaceae archaeon]